MLMETIDESKIPPIPGVEPEKDVNVPPIPGSEAEREKKLKGRIWLMVLAALACIVVALVLVVKCTEGKPDATTEQRHITQPQREEDPVQEHVTVRTYTGAEADSMMRAEMAHMDSMMNEMMNDPFFTGGMGGMLDPFQPPTTSGNAQPPVTERKAKKSVGGIVIFAGNVGGRGLEMKLDLRDPQNVSGSGKWDDGTQLKMLGIGNASDLDVTLYQGNQLLGTLSGTWLGESYRGVYLQDGKQSRFSLTVQ